MDVKAKTKFVRGSHLKFRRYCALIKGKPAQNALDILDHISSRNAKVVFETLKSACANADHNNSLGIADLIVKSATADKGPIMKRFQPRARGRAFPIKKRLSHVTIVVGTKGESE